MSTPEENRDEMRWDNLETAYGADPLDDCPTHGPKLNTIAGHCKPCHDARFGIGHRPHAARYASPSGAPMWQAACLKPGCELGAGIASTDKDEARQWAYDLHERAEHGGAA